MQMNDDENIRTPFLGAALEERQQTMSPRILSVHPSIQQSTKEINFIEYDPLENNKVSIKESVVAQQFQESQDDFEGRFLNKNFKSILDSKEKSALKRQQGCCWDFRKFFFANKAKELLQPHKNLDYNQFICELYADQYQTFDPNARLKGEQVLQKLFSPTDQYVIQPEHKYLMLWEFFIASIVLLYLFFIPIAAFFSTQITLSDGEGNQKEWSYLQKTRFPKILFFYLALFSLLDTLLRFNIGVFKKGVLVKNRMEIAQTYMRGMFPFDFIAFISILIEVVFWNHQIIYLPLIYYVKIFYLYKFNRKMMKILQLHYQCRIAFIITRITIIVLFVSNIFACLWYYAGARAIDGNTTTDSWMRAVWNNQPIMNQSWEQKYILSFYWAYTTIAQVCYGDLIPVNNYELSVTFAIYMVGVLTFAYALDQVMNMLNYESTHRARYEEQMRVMNHFMREQQVSYDLQWKIGNYMEYYWKEDKMRDEEAEQKVIQKLSENLREDLIYETQGDIFEHVPLFQDNFSINFLRRLSYFVEQLRVTPNQKIFKKDIDEQDFALYFILTGHVEVYLQVPKCNGISLFELKNLQSFGEYSFITGQNRTAQCRSLNYTKLLKIERLPFITLLNEFPKDQERFYELKDSLIFGKDFGLFNMSCSICNKTDHLARDCRDILYEPSEHEIVKKLNQVQLERSKYQRKVQKFNQALRVQNQLQQAQQQIRSQLTMSFADRQHIGEISNSYLIEDLDFTNEEINFRKRHISELQREDRKDESVFSQHNASIYSKSQIFHSQTKVEITDQQMNEVGEEDFQSEIRNEYESNSIMMMEKDQDPFFVKFKRDMADLIQKLHEIIKLGTGGGGGGGFNAVSNQRNDPDDNSILFNRSQIKGTQSNIDNFEIESNNQSRIYPHQSQDNNYQNDDEQLIVIRNPTNIDQIQDFQRYKKHDNSEFVIKNINKNADINLKELEKEIKINKRQKNKGKQKK